MVDCDEGRKRCWNLVLASQGYREWRAGGAAHREGAWHAGTAAGTISRTQQPNGTIAWNWRKETSQRVDKTCSCPRPAECMNKARDSCCLKHNGKICKKVSRVLPLAHWIGHAAVHARRSPAPPRSYPALLCRHAHPVCSPLHSLTPPSPALLQVDSVDDSEDIEWEDDKPSKPSDSRRLLRMR